MVLKAKRSACALTIGGLDPGGGAGVLADARAFSRAGVLGCAVTATLTVQSTSGLRAARALDHAELEAQAREVLRVQSVRAVKTGALGSAANVRAVARLLGRHPELPVVVDTVLLPTRGSARLLASGAVRALRDQLLPHATLATVNVPEAEALTGMRVTRLAEGEAAARELLKTGVFAVLVKGGHLTGRHATDLLVGPDDTLELLRDRLDLGPTHGTGCTLASLITGRLAREESPARGWDDLVAAVRWAKRVHHDALSEARDVGGDLRVLFL
ncbi:MAG TPA: hydroxymethylpyrimidine/phosphomethylpyrimidine kinase [Polyangiaceae bacterium]|nr:hydroxymethylpyrimidine/phosphomethylpyrimidine kinase [Polyangiaceae bacterium]